MKAKSTTYKQTEVGLIPNDWEVKTIGEISKLKNGYAFSSDFFSITGPIVITPGNFKLEGGLKFNDKNTIRYSGYISKEMQFQNGDLLIVMTDLTPDCNLLGKPGIVNSEEIILHNQRIGKITITSNQVNQEYLYWFFVSDLFSKRMKETATGSTVRHTSVGSINNSLIAIPTKAEQTAIATALSDADALISSLEKLIAKKRNIKQGAMQKLLEPKEGWEVKKLGEVVDFLDGQRRPIKSNERNAGEIPYYGASGIIDYVNDYIFEDELILLGEDGENIISRNLPLAFKVRGKIWVNNHAHVLKPKVGYDITYLTAYLESLDYSLLNSGTAQPKLNKQACMGIKLIVPPLAQQTRIATILSDIDTEISVLETKLEKYRKVKLGMMQNLLTGKIRLV